MTAAVARSPISPASAAGPAGLAERASSQPSEARAARYTGCNHSPYDPVLLLPGTVVQAWVGGLQRRGEVMPYALEWSHGTFPVRFAATGQWRSLHAGDVTVIAAPPPDPRGGLR